MEKNSNVISVGSGIVCMVCKRYSSYEHTRVDTAILIC